jgi:branched-subunit amino acid aminotransferase/4-amino-4-deoxychorismate lyase
VVRDPIVWVDGRLGPGERLLHREGEAELGLFETLRIENRQPILWNRHMERLAASSLELGFQRPPPSLELAHGLEQLLAARDLVDAAARVTMMRGAEGRSGPGPQCWIEAQALEPRIWPGARSGAARAIFATRPHEPGPLARHKTTSRDPYQLASEDARAAGTDEALLVTPHGDVLEGAISNLFAVIGGEVVTTPVSAGILPGIVRAAVLTLCGELGLAVQERVVAREDLLNAEELFVTNSIQEIVPIAELAGQPIPSQTTGLKLKRLFRASLVRLDG